MERIIVRIDLSPEDAAAAHRALGMVLDHVVTQLGQEPVPQHTKRALTEQREQLETGRRTFKTAMENPVAVDDEGRVIE